MEAALLALLKALTPYLVGAVALLAAFLKGKDAGETLIANKVTTKTLETSLENANEAKAINDRVRAMSDEQLRDSVYDSEDGSK